MFIQSIVYVILTALSATAAFASSMPISKEPKEEKHAPELETKATDTLGQ